MIVERIKQYVDAKNISLSSFESQVGFSHAAFSKAIKNGGAIGTDKLENILRCYPELNPLWVVTGEGDMIKGTDTPSISAQAQRAIAELTLENIRLKDRIAELEGKGVNVGIA